MVHPCGSGAFGYFECTKDVTALTVSPRFHCPSVCLNRNLIWRLLRSWPRTPSCGTRRRSSCRQTGRS
ncbi:hypothetical protein B0H63DRAFT_489759 [Podospora didyma]|uniref:Uncharacterized protein n=1 Tax=Podospora didyma TaxID=330526 RepID=A0AAE0K1J3_9PEZI|nr:hypothetical protein B0H63DRAFT_489759 [Podospora didyma]